MADNIEIFSGNTKRFVFTIRDNNGNIVDLSDYTALLFRVSEVPLGRPVNANPTYSIQKIDSEMDLTNAEDGIVAVILYPEDTTGILGQYAYQLIYTDSDNNVFTVSSGNINIRQGFSGVQSAEFIAWQDEWDIDHGLYKTGQVVGKNGSAYICITNHTPSSFSEPGAVLDSNNDWDSYWALFAEAGVDGNAGGETWESLAANITAVHQHCYMVHTAAGAKVINVPTAAPEGTWFKIVDADGTFNINSLTINRNGQTIMELAENMIVDEKNISFGLVKTATDWRIF